MIQSTTNLTLAQLHYGNAMLHHVSRHKKALTAMSVLVVSSSVAFTVVPHIRDPSRHHANNARHAKTMLPSQHRLLPIMKISQCDPQPNLEGDHMELNDSVAVLNEFGLLKRLDSLKEMPRPSRTMDENHAIFGTLMGRPGLVNEYRIFRCIPEKAEQQSRNDARVPLVLAAVHLGPSLNGHDGIVHGGILSLLVDDAMGFGHEALPVDPPKMAVTANLSLNFRQPLSPETKFIIQVFLQKREGRKIYLEVLVTSPDEKILYVEGTSLYIVPREVA